MTLQTDPITYKRLILVKQLYNEALLKSNSTHNNVDMIMAVISFDLSIETILKTISISLDPNRVPDKEFQSLLQTTENLMIAASVDSVPDKAKIQYIHGLRNDAQHKASYPSHTEVSDCRTYTRDFLQTLIPQVYGINFDKISLTEIIRDADIKLHLTKAEDALAKQDYKTVIKESAFSLNSVITYVSGSIAGMASLGMPTDGLVIQDFTGRSRVDKNAYETLRKMQQTMKIIALGIDFKEHMRFKKITHAIHEVGTNIIWFNEPQTVDENDAEFVLTYSINTILNIENIVGDIKKPFGLDYWFF